MLLSHFWGPLLFGYQRDTTPHLDALTRTNNFVAKESLSSATSSQTGVPFFLNMQRDPRNINVFMSKDYNLFRLAKENGFKTTWISAQTLDVLSDVPLRYIDEIHTKHTDTDHSNLFGQYKDDMLLMLLSKIDLSKKNFIVLQQRSAHTVYEKNYAHRGDDIKKRSIDNSLPYKVRKENAYDNAIRYNDDVLYNIIQYAKNNIEGPIYLFVTADHGENLGENGLWGHGHLVPNSAKIPFLALVERGNEKFLDRLKQLQFPTHFEIAQLIADRLGYKISDPNTKEGVYFITAFNFTGGDNKFITVTKKGNNVEYRD